MSHDTPPVDTDCRTDHESPLTGTIPRQAAVIVVLLSLFAVEPVAAQDNAVCSADNLPSMIEGFFQLTTALGIVGLAIVWQADSLIEMFTLQQETKTGTQTAQTLCDEVCGRPCRPWATVHSRRIDDGAPAGRLRRSRPLV